MASPLRQSEVWTRVGGRCSRSVTPCEMQPPTSPPSRLVPSTGCVNPLTANTNSPYLMQTREQTGLVGCSRQQSQPHSPQAGCRPVCLPTTPIRFQSHHWIIHHQMMNYETARGAPGAVMQPPARPWCSKWLYSPSRHSPLNMHVFPPPLGERDKSDLGNWAGDKKHPQAQNSKEPLVPHSPPQPGVYE